MTSHLQDLRELLGFVSVGSFVVIASAALFSGFCRAPAARRDAWLSAFLGLALLLIVEWTNAVTRGTQWLVRFHGSDPTTSPAVLFPPRSSPSRPADSPASENIARRSAGVASASETSAAPAAPIPVAQLPPQAPSTPAAVMTTPPARSIPQIPAYTLDAVEEMSPTFYAGVTWIVVSICLLIRAFASRLIVWRNLRIQRVSDPGLNATVTDVARRVGLEKRIHIAEHKRLSGPVAFGLLRPWVGLPPDFQTRYTPAQQQVILVHELAHLRHRDPFWRLFADVIAAALWWNPLVWWARRKLVFASEISADEASSCLDRGPAILAECLVALGHRVAERRQPGLCFGGNGFRSDLAKRVEELLNLASQSRQLLSRKSLGFWKGIGPVVVLLTAFQTAAWNQSVTEDKKMMNLRNIWQQGLAALSIAATVSTGPVTTAQTAASPPELQTAVPEPSGTEPITGPAPAQRSAFQLTPELARRYGLPMDQSKTAVESGRPGGTPVPMIDKELMRRYGLSPRSAVATPATSRTRSPMAQKMDDLKFAEVPAFDNLPLKEVLAFLNKESRQQDPEAAGINLLIDNNSLPPELDPVTGAPVKDAAAPDLGDIPVRLHLPLRNIRMRDVLEAISVAAERPIHFAEEAFGVVFAAGPNPSPTHGGLFLKDPVLAARYGLLPPPQHNESPVTEKVERIRLRELYLDNLPLIEVVRVLQAESRKLDPAGEGINFVLANQDGPALSEVTVRFNLPLRDVRLVDAIEAVTRAAERRISYSIESFGVVFNFTPDAHPKTSRLGESTQFVVRTYQFKPERFLTAVTSVFGIEPPPKTGEGSLQPQSATSESFERGQRVQALLRRLLSEIGIDVSTPGKSAFYNEQTGVLMVRGSRSDIDLMTAAVQTLGGEESPAGGGTVTIRGAVNRPGVYTLPPGKTWTLTQVIATAGDLKPSANKRKIQLDRSGERQTLNLTSGDHASQLVRDGDVILVHEALF